MNVKKKGTSMQRQFMDTADLAHIVRAARHLRLKRINLETAKTKLDEWREETLECQPFETWLERLEKKQAAEGGVEK